jgi:hypothetical protein
MVAAAALILLGAPPAGAHNIGSAEPSNWRTRITGVTAEVPGVELKVVEAGGRLELVNRTDTEVIVLGYEPHHEPYLRIGPEGVFENTRSPATYANRERLTNPADAPPEADATAEPEWRKVDSGNSARWHDHRVHFMGTQPPPGIRNDPGQERRLLEWEVPLRYGDDEIVYAGDLTWVPGPSKTPKLAIAVLAGALLVALGLRRRAGGAERVWRAVLAAVLLALTVLDVVRFAGLASDGDVSFASAAGDNLLGVVTWVVALAAVAVLLTRNLLSAAPVAAAAGVLFVVASAADLDILSRSQIPGTAPEGLARLAVAGGFGLGLGVALAAVAAILRPEGLWPRPRPDGGH